MVVLGIDSGSSMTKAVLFDGNTVLDCGMVPTAPRPRQAMRVLHERFYSVSVDAVIATGYGRELLTEADLRITEISCHGAGAAFLCPGCRTVIDIGGQDSKAIVLEEYGQVSDFLMNDKCAAGTGRFMEMTMARIGSDIALVDEFVRGCKPVAINSMCAVFAESEIVGLLAQEVSPGDIVLGCIDSICKRTAIFTKRIASGQGKIFFSGGLSFSGIMRETLSRYMPEADIETHPLAQYTGALGAAVLGIKKLKRNG